MMFNRIKDTVLDIYDAMQRAIATGEPYQTRLDPVPSGSPLLPPTERRCIMFSNNSMW